jgi:uncharacterized membrane protein
MLIAGARLLGGRYSVFGQGLLGGGLATLYFAVFAAHSFYHLVPDATTAFALMTLVTALAGGIALRFNSMLVAVLGILGGYGTPVMLSTGEVNFIGLFGYLVVLGIGVLAMCYRKNWPLVNYLAFACTYVLYFAAMQNYDATRFGEVMPFLVAFFVLFSTMQFLYKVVSGVRSNLLDLLALVANAGIFYAESQRLVGDVYGRNWVAVVTISLAAFYTLHVVYLLIRRSTDRDLLVSFMGLAAFFLAITMPLVLSDEWITASWSLQALVLMWLAGKIGSNMLRNLSYVMYALVLFRFGVIDLSRQFGQFPATADLALTDYVRMMVERAVMFGVPIGSLFAASRLAVRQTPRDDSRPAGGDLRAWISGAGARWLGAGLAVVMVFVYLHLEFDRTVGYFYAPLRLPILTLLWLAVCGLMLQQVLRRESRLLLLVLLALVGVVFAKLVVFDLPSWGLSPELLYSRPYSFRDAGMRLLDFGAVVAFLTSAYFLLARSSSRMEMRAIFGGAGLATLFVYLSLEVNSFLAEYAPGFRAGGISILWSLFALAMLIRGIAMNVKALRYLALLLFAIVAWKVFFVDLERLDDFYRIVAFIVLGVLVLSGSFLYLRFRETFAAGASSAAEPGAAPANPPQAGE